MLADARAADAEAFDFESVAWAVLRAPGGLRNLSVPPPVIVRFFDEEL